MITVMRIFAITLWFLLSSNYFFGQIEYPKAQKKPVENLYFDQSFLDDYQWMEDRSNADLQDWIENENEISDKYLRKLVRSNRVYLNMNKYMFRRSGGYDKYIRNERKWTDYEYGLLIRSEGSEPDLYFRKGNHGNWYELVNRKHISKDDKIVFTDFKSSDDGKYLAYSYNRNGSDFEETRIINPNNKKHFEETIYNTRISNFIWYKNGFFYTEFQHKSENEKVTNPKVKYHTVGTDQSKDSLIYATRNKFQDVNIWKIREIDEIGEEVNEDSQAYIFMEIYNNKTKNYGYFYLKDTEETDLKFRPLLARTKYELNITEKVGNNFIAKVDINDKKQLIAIPAEAPTNFKLLSPNVEGLVLNDYLIEKEGIFFNYLNPTENIIIKTDTVGKFIDSKTLPTGLYTSNIFKFNDEVVFDLHSYTVPSVFYRLNTKDLSYEMINESYVNFDFQDYKFKQTTFKSKDGTEIPIFIVFKEELKQDGSTPFLLETYGGYGTLNLPDYKPGAVYFIENGGAYAYVDVRGEGILGPNWGAAGRKLNKNKTIEDFTSAAEFLIDNKYTSKGKIAIYGASHGGMVIAAALTAKPELYGAACIRAGATDMLRKENYSAGAHFLNINEYGSVQNEEEFNVLKSYSPYHHVENKNYPSTLFVTGSHDNRVEPFHSFKMAAKMQQNPNQVDPILLWVEEQAGHYGQYNVLGSLEENERIYGFLFHEIEND